MVEGRAGEGKQPNLILSTTGLLGGLDHTPSMEKHVLQQVG